MRKLRSFLYRFLRLFRSSNRRRSLRVSWFLEIKVNQIQYTVHRSLNHLVLYEYAEGSHLRYEALFKSLSRATRRWWFSLETNSSNINFPIVAGTCIRVYGDIDNDSRRTRKCHARVRRVAWKRVYKHPPFVLRERLSVTVAWFERVAVPANRRHRRRSWRGSAARSERAEVATVLAPLPFDWRVRRTSASRDKAISYARNIGSNSRPCPAEMYASVGDRRRVVLAVVDDVTVPGKREWAVQCSARMMGRCPAVASRRPAACPPIRPPGVSATHLRERSDDRSRSAVSREFAREWRAIADYPIILREILRRVQWRRDKCIVTRNGSTWKIHTHTCTPTSIRHIVCLWRYSDRRLKCRSLASAKAKLFFIEILQFFVSL